ncbi:hypothetical protein GCM10028775_30840 [Catellatospora paridis]
MAPATAAPAASVIVTDCTFPPLTWVPTSVLTGWFFAASAGVTASASGSVLAGAGSGADWVGATKAGVPSSAEHAVSASGATTASTSAMAPLRAVVLRLIAAYPAPQIHTSRNILPHRPNAP